MEEHGRVMEERWKSDGDDLQRHFTRMCEKRALEDRLDLHGCSRSSRWKIDTIWTIHPRLPGPRHNSNLLTGTSTRLDSVPIPHCLVLNGVRPQLLLPVSSTLHGPA